MFCPDPIKKVTKEDVVLKKKKKKKLVHGKELRKRSEEWLQVIPQNQKQFFLACFQIILVFPTDLSGHRS